MNFEKYFVEGSNLTDEFGERLVEKKTRYEQMIKDIETDEAYILDIQRTIKSKKTKLSDGLILIDKKLQDELLIEHASRILGASKDL